MRYVSTFLTISQAEQSTFQFYSLSDIYFPISTQTCIKQAASMYNVQTASNLDTVGMYLVSLYCVNTDPPVGHGDVGDDDLNRNAWLLGVPQFLVTLH